MGKGHELLKHVILVSAGIRSCYLLSHDASTISYRAYRGVVPRELLKVLGVLRSALIIFRRSTYRRWERTWKPAENDVKEKYQGNPAIQQTGKDINIYIYIYIYIFFFFVPLATKSQL
ncbi:hypothetical protein PUN28_005662 [Cardiocondyla obscurior]|uniref:Uncharacterized protein n=1 Tax=Cardiocondyla obscurior TaxID=286306 RepID=A0AAW2G731_9HYME